MFYLLIYQIAHRILLHLAPYTVTVCLSVCLIEQTVCLSNEIYAYLRKKMLLVEQFSFISVAEFQVTCIQL